MSTHATLSVVPFSASACVGEVMPVSVLLSVNGDAINAAEGTLRFDPTRMSIASVSTGRSVFRFWPTEPTINQEKGTITFTGGLPTPGYVGDKGLLFTVNVVPRTTAVSTTMSWDGSARVLLNDGKGTPVDVTMQNARFELVAATSTTCTAPRATPTPILDTTPPEPFDVVIARTEQGFNGQYFASYYGYDADSGIVRYEVRENGGAWSTHASPYTLKLQSGRIVLEVRAIDAAGNSRISSASMDLIPQRVIDFGPWWFWLIALIAAALAVWRITASRTKNTDKAKDVALQGTLDSPPRIK